MQTFKTTWARGYIRPEFKMKYVIPIIKLAEFYVKVKFTYANSNYVFAQFQSITYDDCVLFLFFRFFMVGYTK